MTKQAITEFNALFLLAVQVEATEEHVPPLSNNVTCDRLDAHFNELRPAGALSISNTHSLSDIAALPFSHKDLPPTPSAAPIKLELRARSEATRAVMSNIDSAEDALRAYDVLSEAAEAAISGEWGIYSEEDAEQLEAWFPYEKCESEELLNIIDEQTENNLQTYREILAQTEGGMLAAINNNGGKYPGLVACHDAQVMR